MRIAVVGATGMVGQVIMKVLEERKFPVDELIPAASERSAGKEVIMNKQSWKVLSVIEALEKKPQIALFSAGGDISRKWAELFCKNGCVVIDNSSAWRMEEHVPLVVPEINASSIDASHRLIANPNCSTIQMVMVLAPLHKKYGIKRIVVSTYQSVTGTGAKAVEQMMNEREGKKGEMAYSYPIDKNCIPQCDEFTADGYTKEEMKLINETRKILGDSNMQITSTAVRVPVTGGHSESVNVTFRKDYDLGEVHDILSNTRGVEVMDNPVNSLYPMPLTAEGRDEVFAGRLRRDLSASNSLNMWIVADNLRKGAATNAVQIAENLIYKRLV